LRLGAAFEQAALDQQTIDALAGGHPNSAVITREGGQSSNYRIRVYL
jgi:hypothetical protein